ncbi:Kelch repeat-containing protein [Acorus calamus]|uniref:Kelch repeat-containing protein n=1 Tax=Acorus calamus TaxID=4465 RepID=A0AAV9EJ52_ACOCL|nr:Kelch repeat-containing protein [Acorus calamus]
MRDSPPPMSTSDEPTNPSVSIGPTVSLLGGSLHGVVWLFDARVNRWSAGLLMASLRTRAAAGIVNGKIYAFGGWSMDEKPWAEVLEPG